MKGTKIWKGAPTLIGFILLVMWVNSCHPTLEKKNAEKLKIQSNANITNNDEQKKKIKVVVKKQDKVAPKTELGEPKEGAKPGQKQSKTQFLYKGKASELSFIKLNTKVNTQNEIRSDEKGRVPDSFISELNAKTEVLIRQKKSGGGFWGEWGTLSNRKNTLSETKNVKVKYVDSKGKPLQNEKLFLGRKPEIMHPVLLIPLTTNEQGEATFLNIPFGGYVVSAAHSYPTQILFKHDKNSGVVQLQKRSKAQIPF